MNRKIISICFIAGILLMAIPSVPLVESLRLEQKIFRSSDRGKGTAGLDETYHYHKG